MKALFITRKYPPSTGGMEMYAYQLAAHFPAVGGDVDVVKPEPPILGRPSFGELARFLLRACRLLASTWRQYDVVLIGDYAIASLAVVAKILSRGKIRTVVSLHGNDLYFMQRKGLAPAMYRLASLLITKSSSIDATIANSRAIQSEAAARGLPLPVVIPLATTLPPAGEKAWTRQPGRVIFVGRLIRYKGLSWFIREVWPRLPRPRELLVAGPVWDEEELACLRGVSDASYLGTLTPDRLAALRATSTAAVMPNIPPKDGEQDEGFGLVALEAASAGTPVVASSCGGIPDAVSIGVTGFLVSPLDAEAWIQKLTEIFEWDMERRDAWAESARSHVATHYTWDITARATLDVLRGAPSAQREESGRSLR